MLKAIVFTLAAAFAAGASAQGPARPDPSDPKAAVPARPYESAFKGYRRYIDPDIASWRGVNDEVGRLKGHAGHLPKSSPAVRAKPAADTPAQGNHGGDGK